VNFLWGAAFGRLISEWVSVKLTSPYLFRLFSILPAKYTFGIVTILKAPELFFLT